MGDRQAAVMISDRQRHRHLAIGLLAELPAVLMVHPDRMLALLGNSCIVDDPRLDRLPSRYRWHHQFLHFAKHPLIRPRRITDEMQEALMLRRNVPRIRHRRHRLHAAPAVCGQKTGAIVTERTRPVGMSDHARHFTDIRFQMIRTLQFASETHFSPPADMSLRNHMILKKDSMRPTDSVVLMHFLYRVRQTRLLGADLSTGGISSAYREAASPYGTNNPGNRARAHD